jgi:hypothetical protein
VPLTISQPAQGPATQRAGFHGPGMGISYTDFGTVQWLHSGQTGSSAAAFYLLPGAVVGVLALTKVVALGAAEASASACSTWPSRASLHGTGYRAAQMGTRPPSATSSWRLAARACCSEPSVRRHSGCEPPELDGEVE